MEINITCPLGSKCEEIKDNKMYRCAWYTCLQGKNPQSEEVINEWQCAMAWMPIMMVENAQQSRGVNQAITSMRDETIARQDLAIATMVEHRGNDYVRSINN
jgi:CxxC motif-containing protein